MGDVRVLVLRAAGINCDEEVMHAWELAGAKPALRHVNAIAARPSLLDEYRIVTIPGGFSYGDDIAAGAILAQRILHDLVGPLRALVQRGGGILGICNGFQVLVKTGLLPGQDLDGATDPAVVATSKGLSVGGESVLDRSFDTDSARVTLTFNDSARFEARWVRLEVCTDRCVFLPTAPDSESPGAARRRFLEMPVEHAEGKVIAVSDKVVNELNDRGRIALRYVDADGRHDLYPANPNGSVEGIAGLCDATGRILGLMPHPDRYFAHTHHPFWTRRSQSGPPDGLSIFRSAVRYWTQR